MPVPRVLLVFRPNLTERYIRPADLERLRAVAEVEYIPCADEQASPALRERLATADAVVVCHGAPRFDAALLEAAPALRFIGELEGDRFERRIDVEAALARGLRVVDTTNGSSYPVAEWALALMMIGLRNAGAHFRRMIAGEEYHLSTDDFGYIHSELSGKRVGLIGGGHIARRLIALLKPFNVDVSVYDPYLSKDIADMLGFRLTNLDYVLGQQDVVVCLAPLTPATRRMLGARELDLIPSGAVLVNVSRGAVIDSEALVARLQRGDIVGCFDVFDPEPIPAANPIRSLTNVFLSPHIAGYNGPSRPRFFSLMVDELERFYAGHETLYDLTPRSLANRRGTPPPPR